MQFETHQLQPPLSKFIESIFHYKNYTPEHSIERVVPTGHIFMLFELDGQPRNTFDNVSLEPLNDYTEAWISGMHTNYLSISALPDSEMLVIQIKPFGGFPFFQFPIHELNNRVVSAEEIMGGGILKLREAILQKEAVVDKFATTERWLLDKLDARQAPSMELMAAAQRLFKEPLSQHQQIIEGYPHTQKHLINQFKKYCGLTPKMLHRILRFNDILQQIQHQKEISWTKIAYLSGYSDQSHFIKEFKEFSGFNPQEFIKQDLNQGPVNFFPLDGAG